jgi:hypothetical protein
MSKPAVFGIVEHESQARQAVSQLEAAGFFPSDISVLSRNADQSINEDLGPLKTETGDTIDAKTRNVGHTNTTKAPEGAAAGAAAGGVVGAVAGWLVAIGALAIPGAGPLVAAGPILAALSVAAVGATAGGVAGSLVGYGIPEYEAKIYAGRIEKGHILIGVHTVNAGESEAAEKALKEVGAHDIKVTTEVCEATAGKC